MPALPGAIYGEPFGERNFEAGLCEGALVDFSLNAERSSQWRLSPCTMSSVKRSLGQF